MSIEKEFVPYNESLELKELGFFCSSFADYFKFYRDNTVILVEDDDRYRIIEDNPDEHIEQILAPTFSQAFRWFRKKYDLVHRIDRDGGWWICAILNLYDEEDQGTIEIYLENCYPNSYEEAELACLRKLIEIVKNG